MSTLYSSFRDETQDIAEIHALRYKTDIMDIISSVVRQHGGKIENVDSSYFSIHFPTGTHKREIYPRVYSVHYEIRFPDDFTIYETLTRDGISSVYFPLQVFPEELQMKYRLA